MTEDRPHLHKRDGRLFCRECRQPVTVTPEGREAGHQRDRRGAGDADGRCSHRSDYFDVDGGRTDQDHAHAETRRREKENRSLHDY